MNGLEQAAPRGLRDRHAILLDVGRILTGTLRRGDLYRAIYEQTDRVLDAVSFYIALYDANTDTASVVYYARDGAPEPIEVAYRGSESFAIREARAGHQSPDDPDFQLLSLALGGLRSGSAICAPIVADGRVAGVIGVQSDAPNAYDEREIELLNAIAAMAGVALGSAEFIRTTERRRREAERLESIGRALTASLDLEEVLRRAVGAAIELIEGDGAAVLLLEQDRQLRIAAVGGTLRIPHGARFALPPRLHARMIEERETVVVENLGHHPLLPLAIRKKVDAGSAAGVPLIAGDNVIGILAIGEHQPRRFPTEELRLLERLSFHVAIAVENARLHEQIRALSLTDPLTGLSNRRHLELVLEKEFAAARRGRKLAVALYDLDHFKAYNDAAGHQAGDEALRAFAHIVLAETRAFDLAARYGGDEFLCILSDADVEGAIAHTARVSQAVASTPSLATIGVSAGLAIFDHSMTGPADLIRAADRELYRKKAERA
ncbi:MAG: sensor domain-containing diguanylate cyclase [Longimicrobiales bacterium]